MRIGAALDALDFIASGISSLERRRKLDAYGTTQALVDRLRAIARARGMTVSMINAQLLKVQFSMEALAGLGGSRSGDEQHVADIRAALAALTGPDCFGYHLDAVE